MTRTEWLRAHRTPVVVLFALLAIGGLLAAFFLPVALFPDVAFPRLVVNIDAGDRPADRMAMEVTAPTEGAIRSVRGVRAIRSVSSRGSCDVSVNFDWGTDMVAAMLQTEAAIQGITGELPAGTSFRVQIMDPTVFPSVAYSLTSDRMSLARLRDIATYQLSPLLSTVAGVAKVTVQGGEES